MYLRDTDDEDQINLSWKGAELVAEWYSILVEAGLTPLDTPIALNIAAGYLLAHNLVPQDLLDLAVEDQEHTTAAIFLTFAAMLEAEGKI